MVENPFESKWFYPPKVDHWGENQGKFQIESEIGLTWVYNLTPKYELPQIYSNKSLQIRCSNYEDYTQHKPTKIGILAL